MPETLVWIVVVLLIAGVVAAVGLGFGIVVAPRLGRLFDRVDANDDEETRDGPD